jgi:hypothetical protein
MGLLDLPIARRTRRNHGIEHATVHVLSARLPGTPFAGRSDAAGFFLYGQVDTPVLAEAVDEALRRLVTEPQLAVHPYCGTNLVVSGFTAGLAALAAVATLPPERRRSGPAALLPRFLLAGTAAALASANLGPLVQARWTTSAAPEGVRVRTITRTERGRHVLHRVELTDTPPRT